MKILNLTQHKRTADQENVIDLDSDLREHLLKWLTFNEIPSKDEMLYRAYMIARLTQDAFELTYALKDSKEKFVMIGGAPYFMPVLEKILIQKGYHPLYAFSKRVCEEKQNPDGSVDKSYVFKHEGFVDPFYKDCLLD